jgi:hypothetical protein
MITVYTVLEITVYTVLETTYIGNEPKAMPFVNVFSTLGGARKAVEEEAAALAEDNEVDEPFFKWLNDMTATDTDDPLWSDRTIWKITECKLLKGEYAVATLQSTGD